MKKKVLVAGASGKLGRRVVAELKAQNYEVRAIARSPRKLKDIGGVEIFPADITRLHTLIGICELVDAVVSCAGAAMTIDDFKNKQTFDAVDFKGNLNLLEEAQKSGVKKFVYVSLAGAENLRHTEYADAHERFVEALRASGLDYAVVRPTGFFSFMLQILDYAKKNRGIVVGDGSRRTNPIHEADVARACVAALLNEEKEITIGGAEIFTRREITELAFDALGKRAKIRRVPPAVLKTMIFPLRFYNRRIYDLMDFGIAATQIDCLAPPSGDGNLREFFSASAKM
jgi:uncharacterized protein YbjT (DUF2867 family)